MKEQRVLVTGSSRGIGRAIALELAAGGWHVAVHSNASDLGSVERELGSAFAGKYHVDLSESGAAQELWRFANADGPLHALVNNAGVYYPIKFAESTDAEFEANYRRTFAINFEAPLQLIRCAVNSFENGGSILNVASRVGFRGESGAALYAASKAALINLTRSLAVELSPRNIRLFGVAPGWVETAMARDGMQERLTTILKDIPLGRMATPEDCAAAARFLLSDGAAYLSGVFIDINGASYFH